MEITLKNDTISATFSSHGAELKSLIRDGREYMWHADPAYWNRTSPVLFPLVGALNGGEYRYHGYDYPMSQHGFARDMEFEPVTKLDNFHSYVLKSNKNTLTRYPFDFELYTTYRLYQNELTTIYKVINTGKTNMPFCIGGHPAFKIDSEAFKNGDYYLEFEEDEDKIHFLYFYIISES